MKTCLVRGFAAACFSLLLIPTGQAADLLTVGDQIIGIDIDPEISARNYPENESPFLRSTVILEQNISTLPKKTRASLPLPPSARLSLRVCGSRPPTMPSNGTLLLGNCLAPTIRS